MIKKKTRRIFISATGQNHGKTIVSLGLIYAFREKYKNIGFIKPIGQRYLIEKNEKIDEDSVLIDRVFGFKTAIKDMSPVAVERGFTKRYIITATKRGWRKRIKDSYRAIAKNKDLVIIEGTGHAGVGSVFDLSNATVAKMLGSKVVIVSSGGIGRPIDEIMLNAALFEKEGVEIAGVIINKVRPEKYEDINHIVRLGLKRKGLKVLGVIPYKKILSAPTVAQIIEELGFKLLHKTQDLEMSVGKILVGAMAPHNALNYLEDKSLIITPGDREDLILAVASFQLDRAKEGLRIAGIVLTGNIKPHKSVIDLVKRAKIPLICAQKDTYTVASKIHDLTIKVQPEDLEKTKIIEGLIKEYVDIDLLSSIMSLA